MIIPKNSAGNQTMIDAVGQVSELLNTALERFVPDKIEREKISAGLSGKIFEYTSAIIIAEAQGESWLQRNWRPLLMLNFGVLLNLSWLGLAPDIPETTLNSLMLLMQIGIGGYMGLRTIEKVTDKIKGTQPAQKPNIIQQVGKAVVAAVKKHRDPRGSFGEE